MRRAAKALAALLFVARAGNGCESQEVRLFSPARVAPDAGSQLDVPPAVPLDVAPPLPEVREDAAAPPAPSLTQPACRGAACESCVAETERCSFADTRWLCHPFTGECQPPCAPEGPSPLCPPNTQCHPDYGLCVSCVSGAECAGATPVCDSQRNVCVQCERDSDCAGQEDNRVCEPLSQRCVECAADADCTEADKPFCKLSEFECEDDLDDD